MKEKHEGFFCARLARMPNFLAEGKFFSLLMKLIIPLIPIGVSFISGFNYLLQYDKKIIGIANISDFYRYFFLKTPPEKLFAFFFCAAILYLILRVIEYKEKRKQSLKNRGLVLLSKLAVVLFIPLTAYYFITSSSLEYARQNDARYSISLSNNTEKKCFRVVGTVGSFLMILNKENNVEYINLGAVNKLKILIETLPFYRPLAGKWASQEAQQDHRRSYVEIYEGWADKVTNICGETPPPISEVERPVEIKH